MDYKPTIFKVLVNFYFDGKVHFHFDRASELLYKYY
jgi:hypothetical protein